MLTRKEEKLLRQLGEKVKQLRKEKGMTLEELATITGKAPQSISRLEEGKINPSYLYLLSIAGGLGKQFNLSEL